MRDEVFEALSNEHRRTLLLALSESGPQVVAETASVGEAAGALPLDWKTRVTMQHVHLPKLEEDGFVDWDEDTGTVSRGPQFEEIRPLLECVAELADREPSRRRGLVDEDCH